MTRIVARAPGLITAVLAVLFAMVTVPPAGHAAEEVSVTWPARTELNPATTTYVVQVTGVESGIVVVHAADDFEEQVQATPTQEGLRIEFPSDGEWKLAVSVCVARKCAVVSTSPQLYVYSAISFSSNDGELGPDDAPARIWPVAPFDVEWSVERSFGGQVVATGMATGIADGRLPAVDVDLPTGTGVIYRARIVMNGDPYGPLKKTLAFNMTWDDVAPSGSGVHIGPYSPDYDSQRTVYPLPDEGHSYWDFLWIRAEAGSETTGDAHVVIRDSSNEPVFSAWQGGPHSFGIKWDGRDASGQVLPEGAYEATIRVYDRAGNFEELKRTLQVSHQVLGTRTFRATVTPEASVTERRVGRCARLWEPARENWPGSFGYRSTRTCADQDPDEWAVTTFHRLTVPTSVVHDYGDFQITVRGGKSAGAVKDYLRFGYFSTQSGWTGFTHARGGVSSHPGVVVDGDPIIVGEGGEPGAVVWLATNNRGAKFDVKTFTVEYEYVGLVD